MYNLFWRTPGLPFTQKQVGINVPAGSVVTNAASLRFTGKGFTNYGKIQQENMMRLLENFSGPLAPEYPTVGQLWFDTQNTVLKICVSTAPSPEIWEQLNAYQITPNEPANPALGDLWFKKNGPSSGVLYVYDGVGRFPEKAWDAVVEGYYPASTSPTLGIRMNGSAALTASPTQSGNFRLFGKDSAGNLTDTQGSVIINGAPYFIENATHATAYFRNISGYIMVDIRDMTAVNADFKNLNRRYFFVTKAEDDTWMFDDGSHPLLPFTPNDSQFIIGTLNTLMSGNLINSSTIWTTGISILQISEVVASTHPSGKIGGWQQLWPTVDYIGARDEYDAVYLKLASILGTPKMGVTGGSQALRRLIDYLPKLEILDASLQNVIYKKPDSNVAQFNTFEELRQVKVQPTSQDWDLLLAACRYAVDRLETGDMVADIPAFGFVQDGLPMHPTVMNSNPTDVKFLSQYAAPRKISAAKRGIMSSIMSFQELMNVLDYANKSKYTMKGIYEASGSSTYPPTVINPTQFQLVGDATLLSAARRVDMLLPFSRRADSDSFLNSGGAMMVEVFAINKPGISPTNGDLALQAALAIRGKIKVTGDATLFFNYGTNTELSANPIAIGFNTNMTPNSSTTVDSYTQSSLISTVWSVGRSTSYQHLRISLSLNPATGATFTNTIGIRVSYIFDDIKFAQGSSSYNVYGKPYGFSPTGGHAGGSGISTAPAVFTIGSAV